MLFTQGTELQIIFRRPVYLLCDDDDDDESLQRKGTFKKICE